MEYFLNFYQSSIWEFLLLVGIAFSVLAFFRRINLRNEYKAGFNTNMAKHAFRLGVFFILISIIPIAIKYYFPPKECPCDTNSSNWTGTWTILLPDEIKEDYKANTATLMISTESNQLKGTAILDQPKNNSYLNFEVTKSYENYLKGNLWSRDFGKNEKTNMEIFLYPSGKEFIGTIKSKSKTLVFKGKR